VGGGGGVVAVGVGGGGDVADAVGGGEVAVLVSVAGGFVAVGEEILVVGVGENVTVDVNVKTGVFDALGGSGRWVDVLVGVHPEGDVGI